MSNTNTECPFLSSKAITEILEGYRSNLGNSNKFRYNLFAYIDECLAARDTAKREALLKAVGEATRDYETDMGSVPVIDPADMRQAIESIFGEN